jgi:hypothetical protein
MGITKVKMLCVDIATNAIENTHYNHIRYKHRIEKIAKITCRYSKLRNISPYIIIGLMRHESFFKPSIVGISGDIGLLQLNPRYFGGKCNLKRIRCNLRQGTRYLQQIKRAKPTRYHWLKRYNWNSKKHHLNILWLAEAYKRARINKSLYKLIRSRKYMRIKKNYKCIRRNLCMENK